jgi:hypothetical protein
MENCWSPELLSSRIVRPFALLSILPFASTKNTSRNSFANWVSTSSVTTERLYGLSPPGNSSALKKSSKFGKGWSSMYHTSKCPVVEKLTRRRSKLIQEPLKRGIGEFIFLKTVGVFSVTASSAC